jgi:hypothetical protein
VDVENVFIFVASVGSGDDVRLTVNSETYVADKSFIENLVDGVAIVDGALRFADYAGAWSGSIRSGG